MSVNYVVVPTSNIDYQSWQIKFLYWSKNKVKQPGKLLLLNSEDIPNRPWDNYESMGEDIIHIKLPNWAQQWVDENGEWWGGIPNKYNAVLWMCNNLKLNDDDTLLFLDPDMIFLEQIDYEVNDNEVVGTRWVDSSSLESMGKIERGEAIMYPFLIRFSTLKKIANRYRDYCVRLRKETNNWISEMWGFDYAIRDEGVNIVHKDYFGHCTSWWDREPFDSLPAIIHFPNIVYDKDGENLWFKQDFTTRQTNKYNYKLAKTEVGSELVKNLSQYQSDYFYWPKLTDSNLFKFYNGEAGYVVFKPWPGGFNNIRMSFELAYVIAYLKNRTLVLPPTYSMYLLEGESNLSDFFDMDDLGIKSISFEQFCELKLISNGWDGVKANYQSVVLSEKPTSGSSDLTLNMELVNVPDNLKKWKRVLNWSEIVNDSDEVLFFDSNLLGSFHQVIHSSRMKQAIKLVARHIHYKREILDLAWDQISDLGDLDYYAMHVRRNDFQYKDVYISGEELLGNIKDRIPNGAKLYIATDHKDKSFFDPLRSHYELHFYNEIPNIDPNIIPIIEQLICSRAKMFIGNDYSTLSSLICRMRGYMSDVPDKDYHVNTKPYSSEHQCTLAEEKDFIANWHREYKDSWDFSEPSIFVSIASYRDSQVHKTIESCLKYASNSNRVFIALGLQDEEAYGQSILDRFDKEYPGQVSVKQYDPKEARSVVDVRHDLMHMSHGYDYILQLDSHIRFKEHWDSILINQHASYESDKVIVTTYPNEFVYPDPNREYLRLPYNAPLVFDKFFGDGDYRFKAKNLDSLKPYESADNKRISAGFFFTTTNWVDEVGIPRNVIVYNGEEDYMTYKSFLKGWNIKCPAEAVIWHNYDWKDRDGIPYRYHNTNLGKDYADKSTEVINKLLFEEKHEKSVEELEAYLGVSFKKKPLDNLRTYILTIPRNENRLDENYRNCYDKSSMINPEKIIGIDGKNVINDTRYDSWASLPFDCCIDDDTDQRCVWALIQNYIDIFDRIVSEGFDGPVLIIEDDATITEEYLDSFDDYLREMWNNVPSDWQLLYLGGRAHNRDKEERVNAYWFRTKGTMKTTAIVYNGAKVCEFLRDALRSSPKRRPIDVNILETIIDNNMVCYRSDRKLFYQRGFLSSIYKDGHEVNCAVIKDWDL